VRTAEKVHVILESNKLRPDIKFCIVSNPEFLAEGTAIADLEKPDRVLIGGSTKLIGAHTDESDVEKAVRRVCEIYEHWVPKERIITTNLWTSELSKLASNALLAQRISTINAISALCEQSGADVQEVSKVLGMDPRIGSRYLSASVGFGGSCLKKDVLALVYISECEQLDEVAQYFKMIVDINESQKIRFANRIIDSMYGTIRGKKIGILGYAFKKDTADTRETCAYEIIQLLVEEGAKITVYDPQVPNEEIMTNFPGVNSTKNYLEAVNGMHAIVILTEWDEFKNYDYKAIFETMPKPAFLFDGRNILDHTKLSDIGFEVHAVGKKSMHHTQYGYGTL